MSDESAVGQRNEPLADDASSANLLENREPGVTKAILLVVAIAAAIAGAVKMRSDSRPFEPLPGALGPRSTDYRSDLSSRISNRQHDTGTVMFFIQNSQV